MATKNLITEDKDKLDQLFQHIKNNSATVDEYREYENLLEKYGIEKGRIMEKLQREGIYSWDDYYKARQSAVTYDQKKKTEVAVLGGILALGLLLYLLSGSNRK